MKELALIAFAEQVVGQPFVWGETDCGMLALRALDVILIQDVSGPYRGMWSDEATALAHFQTELPSEVLARLGMQRMEPGLYAIGDILLAPKDPWPECAAVCLGGRCLMSHTEHGVAYVRTGDFVKAATSLWRRA